MRLYNNRLYLLAFTPGLSGFQRWNEKELRIMTGAKARGNYKLNVIEEYRPGSHQAFRLERGELPEHQWNVSESVMMMYLKENPYVSAFVMV